LIRAAQKEGVSFLPWIMIFDLLEKEGKVVGALGFNWRQGTWITFLSKATVLSNGGGAALYRRHDNPVRNTGDGYALAFQIGCRLRDMEFVQFFPAGLAETGKPLMLLAASLADVGRIINSLGEDVLAKYRLTEKPVIYRSRDFFLWLFLRRKAKEGMFFSICECCPQTTGRRITWPRVSAVYLLKTFPASKNRCASPQ